MHDIELEIELAPHIMARLRTYAVSMNMTVEAAAKRLVENGVEREMAKREAEGDMSKPVTDIVT